jgi:signal transduction histidine kinase
MAALGPFSSGTSHQAKNPLAIILGSIEFLERRFSNGDAETSIVINNIN